MNRRSRGAESKNSQANRKGSNLKERHQQQQLEPLKQRETERPNSHPLKYKQTSSGDSAGLLQWERGEEKQQQQTNPRGSRDAADNSSCSTDGSQTSKATRGGLLVEAQFPLLGSTGSQAGSIEVEKRLQQARSTARCPPDILECPEQLEGQIKIYQSKSSKTNNNARLSLSKSRDTASDESPKEIRYEVREARQHSRNLAENQDAIDPMSLREKQRPSDASSSDDSRRVEDERDQKTPTIETSQAIEDFRGTNEVISNVANRSESSTTNPVVLVSKNALNNLSDQIALSLNRMRHLEEQMSMIPELQKRLDEMIISQGSQSINNQANDNNANGLKLSTSHDDVEISLATSSSLNRAPFVEQRQYQSDLQRQNGQCLGCESSGILHRGQHDPVGSMIHHPSLQRLHYKNNPPPSRHHSFMNHPTSSTPSQQLRSNSFSLRTPSECSQSSLSCTASEQLFQGRGLTAGICTAKPLDRNPNQQASSSKTVDYQDLLNDLISLSCSVNYPSTNQGCETPPICSPLSDDRVSEQNQLIKLGLTLGEHEESNSLFRILKKDQRVQANKQAKNICCSIGHQSPSVYHQMDPREFKSRENYQHLEDSQSQANLAEREFSSQDHSQDRQQIYCSTKSKRSINSASPRKLNTTARAADFDVTPFPRASNILNGFCNNQASRDFNLNGPSKGNHLRPTYDQQAHSNDNNYPSNNNLNSMTSNNSGKTSGYVSSSSLSRQDRARLMKPRLESAGLEHYKRVRPNYDNHFKNKENRPDRTAHKSTLLSMDSNRSSQLSSLKPRIMKDISTMTDLAMTDLVSRSELNEILVEALSQQKRQLQSINTCNSQTYSGSSLTRTDEVTTDRIESIQQDDTSRNEDLLSNEQKSPISSSPHNSTDAYEDARVNESDDPYADMVVDSSTLNSHKVVTRHVTKKEVKSRSGSETDDDTNSSNDPAAEPFSLGSCYQDPSDFEEYFSYGHSLERRTREFMSQTGKAPNDLRHSLAKINESLRQQKDGCSNSAHRVSDNIQSSLSSSSHLLDEVKREWFAVAAKKDSKVVRTKLYVDYFESFSKHLLNLIVNMTDIAGNTAMHYAASHFRLDIIKVLLDTRICDTNCRNKAGYTPIMLLALVDISDSEDKNIARHLFTLGDVNIRSRTTGQTALMLAARHGQLNTCRLLLECGADPSLRDVDGSTALMCGSEVGDEAVVRCLLSHRLTDPSATDNDGLDALSIAMNNKHKEVAMLLYSAKNVQNHRAIPSQLQKANFRKNRTDITCKPSGKQMKAGTNESATGYVGASLRRTRARAATNVVRRADSLIASRIPSSTEKSKSYDPTRYFRYR